MVIWRVRCLSCDGGHVGRVWSEKFFFDSPAAIECQQNLISTSNDRNPKYLYKTEQESIDNVFGYCNWQFGTMIVLDSVKVQ